MDAIINAILQPIEVAGVGYAYTAAGTAGVWRLLYPGGDPSLVPWVGLVGGAVIVAELPALKAYSPALVGLGGGVFFADVLGFNAIASGTVGAVAAQMLLKVPGSGTQTS